jgi:hypothetical protein
LYGRGAPPARQQQSMNIDATVFGNRKYHPSGGMSRWVRTPQRS